MKKYIIFLFLVPFLLSNCTRKSDKSIWDFATENEESGVFKGDWLINEVDQKAELHESKLRGKKLIVLKNGLVNRSFIIDPNVACVQYRNLRTGESILRGVKPEAIVTINGNTYEVGGLKGQVEYAYINRETVESLSTNPEAFCFVDYSTNPIKKRPEWFLEGKPRTSGRFTFTTRRFYKKEAPLQSSGLIGPVTLEIHKN